MRRSNRSAMRSDAASALADLAARKASGTSRLADYQIHEEADIFETVDESAYADIAAQKRKEARDFIVPGGDGDALEREFDIEDELSMVQTRAPKRRRTNAPIRKPTQRAPSSFFNSMHHKQPRALEEPAETDSANKVLDVSMLDREFETTVRDIKSARRKKRAVQRRVGDMLFDTNNAPESCIHLPITNTAEDMHDLQKEESEYAAPPPMLPRKEEDKKHNKKSAAKSMFALADPVLEDSLDVDALVNATDAAIGAARPPINSKFTPTKTTSPQPVPKMSPAARAAALATPALPNYPANAPLAREANGDVLMFWTDAHEVRVNGGQHLYLFGKAAVGNINSGRYSSVCVRVYGMERTLYVLPRKNRVDSTGKPTDKPVKIVPDVHSEVMALLLRKNNSGNASGYGSMVKRAGSNVPTTAKAKKVIRACPFADADAPREPTEYLKVKFPYDNANVLEPNSYGETFSRVFGSKTSAPEALCLKRKLKGPGWIRLKNATPAENKGSHAKYTLRIDSPDNIQIAMDMSNAEPPTMSALCIQAKTVINRSGAHEVVVLSGVFIRDLPLTGPLPDAALEPGGVMGTRDFVLCRAPDGQSVPFGFSDMARSSLARGGSLEVVPNEPALLNNFLTKLLRLDPDVLIGHDISGFGLDVLLTRMNARRSREWSRLGRLIQRRDLNQVVKNHTISSWFKSEAVAGRLILDTYMHSKDLLPREKDYSLSALCENVLAPSARGKFPRDRILPPTTDVSKVLDMYKHAETLCNLVRECTLEARTSARLAAHLSILPLTRQLTNISGNLWSHTMRGARAERIEYLLCHEFKLIGSNKAGDAGKAGDVAAKLLLPDKLTKSERIRMQEAHEAQQKAAEAATAVPKTPAPAAAYGYGGSEDVETSAVKSSHGKGSKSKNGRRKPQYSGGLVLEPIKGYYDQFVLQLDFNSLYPSIIQEFNICFTTINLKRKQGSGETQSASEPEQANSPANIEAPPTDVNLNKAAALEGVLPRVLRRLVEQRRQVKKLLKEERQRAGGETIRAQQLDIRQLAIKLTANSLYGCLGFESGRFFARPLAEVVTSQGRETLRSTVDVAQDTFNAKVIYGDTDSLFVSTGLNDIGKVRKLGMELKRDVNKRYRTLEIEIDAIYRKMLLLKKKKYAALKLVDPTNPNKTVREVKGLDLVRHDWCDLSHDASENFLSQIFANQSGIDDAMGNILTFLKGLAQRVRSNVPSLDKYVITRALTKRPQDYPDGSALPHVVVATRLIKEAKKRIQPGDYIKYVICLQSGQTRAPSSSIASRAYHPDEVKAAEGKLVIDVKYYLENQVLPPVMRLCDPIESIEASCIADALGLDGRKYERKDDGLDLDSNYLALGPQDASEKFKDVDELLIPCGRCDAQTVFRGVLFDKDGKEYRQHGLTCSKCARQFPTSMLMNTLSLSMRDWVRKYYTSPLIRRHDNTKLTYNVRLGQKDDWKRGMYNEAWLYRQLRYMHYLMDYSAHWAVVPNHEDLDMPLPRKDVVVYDTLLKKVDELFDASAYRFVDLSQFLSTVRL